MHVVAIPGSILCAVKAMRKLVHKLPAKHRNSPCFSLPNAMGGLLCTNAFRKNFDLVYRKLDTEVPFLTHSFHRGGVGWSYKVGSTTRINPSAQGLEIRLVFKISFVPRGGSGGPQTPLTTKNEAPAPKFYKIEAPEWQF